MRSRRAILSDSDAGSSSTSRSSSSTSIQTARTGQQVIPSDKFDAHATRAGFNQGTANAANALGTTTEAASTKSAIGFRQLGAQGGPSLPLKDSRFMQVRMAAEQQDGWSDEASADYISNQTP